MATNAEFARLLTVRFRDPVAVAAKEGGAAGTLAATLAPKAVEEQMYSEFQKQLADQLKARGIDAEVNVVTSASSFGKPGSSDFGSGLVVGAGAVGVLWLVMRLWRGR